MEMLRARIESLREHFRQITEAMLELNIYMQTLDVAEDEHGMENQEQRQTESN